MHSFNLLLRFPIARCNISAVLSCRFLFQSRSSLFKVFNPSLYRMFRGNLTMMPYIEKPSELPLCTFQTIIVFVKHFYGRSTLLTVPLFHDYWMARLSVAQGPSSVVLPTVHSYHYAFQKFPFFCVTLYDVFWEQQIPFSSIVKLQYIILNFEDFILS